MAPAPPVPPEPKPGGSPSAGAAGVFSSLASAQVSVDDKVVIDVELDAYKVLHELCAAVRVDLQGLFRDPIESQIVLLDAAMKEALTLRPLLDLQLRNLIESFRGAAARAAEGLRLFGIEQPGSEGSASLEAVTLEGSALSASTNVAAVAASGAIGLLGLFREDISVSGRPVTIPQPVLAFTLARHLTTPTTRFHYPTFFPPPNEETVLAPLLKTLDAVQKERHAVSELVEQLVARLMTIDSKDPRFAAARCSLDSAREAQQAAEVLLDQINQGMTHANSATGLNRIQLLQCAGKVESLHRSFPQRVYFLFAQIVSSGGNLLARRGPLAWLRGRSLQHSSGCAVTYALFRADGTLLTSNTIGKRSGYVNSLPSSHFGY